jgi:hypothetical protein
MEVAMKRLLVFTMLATMLAGCVVVPARDYERHQYRGEGYWGDRYGYGYGYRHDRNWNYYGGYRSWNYSGSN